jgi:hypothetical protein
VVLVQVCVWLWARGAFRVDRPPRPAWQGQTAAVLVGVAGRLTAARPVLARIGIVLLVSTTVQVRLRRATSPDSRPRPPGA